ncbi:KamA family radical SAM protein, partial [Bacteroidota bacterium]
KKGKPASRSISARGADKWVGTKIIDDVFTDEIALLKPRFEVDYDAYLERLWEASPEIYKLLKRAKTLEDARNSMFRYIEKVERNIFSLDNDLHILQKATARVCIRTLRSIIGPINESRTKVSSLEYLWKLARGEREKIKSKLSVGFILEFINLFRGIAGKSTIYLHEGIVKKGIPEFFKLGGIKAAAARMHSLDELGTTVKKYLKKYPSGLEDEVRSWRHINKRKILRYYQSKLSDWDNYKWHLKNVIRTSKPLLDLIALSNSQKEAIKKAVQNKIPFGITPYYLSLMDKKLTIGYDHAVRAQVLPPLEYVEKMAENRKNRGKHFDFMGEHETSPIELITRRYPGIAIFKPFNTCAQICVYCQRNWEIDRVLDPKAMGTKDKIKKAMAWFDKHKSVGDVLITGGDPLVMSDQKLDELIGTFAKKKHIYRIRLGTRTPVVLPMRWTDELVSIISKYHDPPEREIAIVTHFEHSYEITPEAMEAVQKIRKAGMSVYNQVVYTMENSRRFELAKLRLDLRSIGVDPYYTFNMKGKEETRRYMVPIARILQERKEEARLLPGLDRTDEPVFNVPKLGKNHLRAMQDHRVVMILPDGSRVYELHPWEKNISPVPPYNYVDVPIYDYLEELASRGENIRDYSTIWYYY